MGKFLLLPEYIVIRLSLPTRDAVLGHLETGHTKNRTQCGVTHPLKPCLIGICKDMMSWMDLMRALGMQDEIAGTSLVPLKFSSSISCWKGLHKLQEGKSKNTKEKPWLLHFGASAKDLSPAFYSHKETCWRWTRESTVYVSRTHSWQHSRTQSKLQ